MDFAGHNDRAFAALIMLRRLPELLGAFEREAQARGFEIAERSQFTGEDGATVPVLVLRRGKQTMELRLRNALEDLLTVDRDASPVRIDPRLLDDAYATRKVAEIAEARLELAEIMLLPEADPERERRLREVARRFEWVRVARVDGGDGPVSR